MAVINFKANRAFRLIATVPIEPGELGVIKHLHFKNGQRGKIKPVAVTELLRSISIEEGWLDEHGNFHPLDSD